MYVILNCDFQINSTLTMAKIPRLSCVRLFYQRYLSISTPLWGARRMVQLALLFLSSVTVQLPTPSTVAPSATVLPSAIVRAAAQQPVALASSHNAVIFPSTTAVAYIGQEPADTASRAAAMRGAAAKEDAVKAARAQKALERAQNAKEGKERLAAANAAVEGLKPCPTGTFGSNTGMLSAQSCYRVRDGNIDATKKTGAFLIF